MLNRDMSGTPAKVARYRFGPFELDPVEGTLTRNGMRVRLQDLPYRLLLMLLERPGETITRDEVRQHLWPENTFVEFDNSLGVAIRKVRESLNDDADEPRYVATVPRRGYRFVAPVVVETLPQPLAVSATPPVEEHVPAPVALPAAPAIVSRRRRMLYWTAGGVAFAALLAGVIYRYYPRAVVRTLPGGFKVASHTVPAVRLRRSVAVLGFRNLPGRHEDDWLSPVFSEMLDTELGTRGDLRMVSAEDVARVKHDLPPTGEGTLARATLDRLRENPGADVVVLGSYTTLPGKNPKIRLDLRVQDTSNGETVAEEAITGSESDLFDLAAEAGTRLRQRLGMSANSFGDADEIRVALPRDQKTARLYVEGRARLWAFEFQAARDLLMKAVEADSQFPLAHSALSEVWFHLGSQDKARAEAQKARELAQDLPQEDRLLIEGQYWRAMGNSVKTVEAYRTLYQMFPDNLDYGLLLATAEMGSQPAAALETLAALRRLPPPLGNDARIDMTEASAWIGENLTRARAAARTAIEKGKAQGRPLLVARTLGFLCQQGAGIGTAMQEAIADCEAARAGGLAIDDQNGAAIAGNNLGALHYEQGDLSLAGEMFEQATKQFRKVDNVDGVATATSNLGSVRATQGKLTEAQTLIERSIPIFTSADDNDGVALSLQGLGDVLRQSGHLQKADEQLRLATTTATNIQDKTALAYILTGQGDLLRDRGDLDGARKAYKQALAIRAQVGEKQNEGEDQIALDRLSVESGHAAEVEHSLRSWKEQFHTEHQADDELLASSTLIEALQADGKQAEARAVLESSQALAAVSQNIAARLRFAMVAARLLMASDPPEAARPVIERSLREARAHGLAGMEFEAMLASAELEMKLGHANIAHKQLASLESEAREKGFGLIARKALAARG